MKFLTLVALLWFSIQLFRVLFMNATLDRFTIALLLVLAIVVNISSLNKQENKPEIHIHHYNDERK